MENISRRLYYQHMEICQEFKKLKLNMDNMEFGNEFKIEINNETEALVWSGEMLDNDNDENVNDDEIINPISFNIGPPSTLVDVLKCTSYFNAHVKLEFSKRLIDKSSSINKLPKLFPRDQEIKSLCAFTRSPHTKVLLFLNMKKRRIYWIENGEVKRIKYEFYQPKDDTIFMMYSDKKFHTLDMIERS
jgi:hypothetical protein